MDDFELFLNQVHVNQHMESQRLHMSKVERMTLAAHQTLTQTQGEEMNEQQAEQEMNSIAEVFAGIAVLLAAGAIEINIRLKVSSNVFNSITQDPISRIMLCDFINKIEAFGLKFEKVESCGNVHFYITSK